MDLEVQKFQDMIWRHYHRHGRIFPWRETLDPYAILVSEVMLQQTQTGRIEDAYLRFLEAFPTAGALARAPLKRVLTLWQGLGYNRRAINLQRAAQRIMETYGGEVPASYEELLTLPGVGPYTASAVCVFAFGQSQAVLDTNVRSVYLHVFFPDSDAVRDSELVPLMEQTFDEGNPREWVYALMDYGAMLKKVHPNPSRRSAHYQRQSPFEGSRRQKRGMIVRFMLHAGKASAHDMAKACAMDESLARDISEDLVQEGFLSRSDGTYMLD